MDFGGTESHVDHQRMTRHSVLSVDEARHESGQTHEDHVVKARRGIVIGRRGRPPGTRQGVGQDPFGRPPRPQRPAVTTRGGIVSEQYGFSA